MVLKTFILKGFSILHKAFNLENSHYHSDIVTRPVTLHSADHRVGVGMMLLSVHVTRCQLSSSQMEPVSMPLMTWKCPPQHKSS